MNIRSIGLKRSAFTLVEIMIVVLIIGILLAIAVPNFLQARESSRAKSCINNLKIIDTGKQQWLMDNKTSSFTAYNIAPGATTLGVLSTCQNCSTVPGERQLLDR